MTIKTATRRLAMIAAWAEGSKIRGNARDGGTTRNAVRMRRAIKRILARRLRRLGGAFIEEDAGEFSESLEKASN